MKSSSSLSFFHYFSLFFWFGRSFFRPSFSPISVFIYILQSKPIKPDGKWPPAKNFFIHSFILFYFVLFLFIVSSFKFIFPHTHNFANQFLIDYNQQSKPTLVIWKSLLFMTFPRPYISPCLSFAEIKTFLQSKHKQILVWL